MKLYNLSTQQQQQKQTDIKNTILSKPWRDIIIFIPFIRLTMNSLEKSTKKKRKKKNTHRMEIKRKEKKKAFLDRNFFLYRNCN